MSGLIERIARERKQQQEYEFVRQQAAIRRGQSVEQNSDFVWQEIIGGVKALVSEYNKAFPGAEPVTISEREGVPPQGFDVSRPLCPAVKLSVRRSNPYFIEFSVSRLGMFLSKEEKSKGRIDIHSDDDRNIYFSIKDTLFAAADQVAEYLMGVVLS